MIVPDLSYKSEWNRGYKNDFYKSASVAEIGDEGGFFYFVNSLFFQKKEVIFYV